MCYRTTCPTCQKATWGGCGAHIESALRGVPEAERCQCHAKPKEKKPAQGASAQAAPQSRGFWPFG